MTQSSTHPLVSVVIPHYGGTDILGECLTSLNKCSYPNLEIIVVDNNFPDDSIQFIKSNFTEVKLIRSEFNRGFAGGCNFGVQHAKGEYLLILNSDTIHEPDWIDHLVNMMESNPNIIVTILIMPVPAVDLWINIVFPLPGVEFSVRLKKMKVNMMNLLKYFGHLERLSLLERMFLIK